MRVLVRLIVRRLRYELAVIGGASLFVAVATMLLAVEITGSNESPSQATWLEVVPYDRLALLCLPIVTAILVATSLIASEFASGTSAFAWSIAVSRRRWLWDTVVVGILIVVVVSTPLAIAASILSGALGPLLDATTSPSGVDPTAALLLARPIAAFGIVAVVSTLVGRSLPTLFAGLVATCFVIGVIELGFAGGRQILAEPMDPQSVSGSYYLGTQGPNQVPMGLTSDARTLLDGGETLALICAAGGALVLAGVMVERRLPNQ